MTSVVQGFVDTIQRQDLGRRSYHITLNRPEKLNSFSSQMYREVRSGVLRAEGDSRIDAVVIDAAPCRAFATGGDLHEFLALAGSGPDAYARHDDEWRVPFEIMLRTSKPIVAVVDGLCVAGGLVTCLCSDIVIATEGSSFAVVEARVGLSDTYCQTILPRVVGMTRARYMAMTGAMIDGVTAERWGIVTNLVGRREDLAAKVDDILRMLETTSPHSRALYRRGITSAVPAQNEFQALSCALGADGNEGLAAFLERRPPNWHRPDGELQ